MLGVNLKIYLVGGAVRDEIMGLKAKERDYVVVGGTPNEMEAQGFKPVGKEFPVFLHPQTQEEYALARTERKVAKGYRGFEFYADPTVTLEEDLKRRDLTINAIAKDEKNHTIIDPYHGQDDVKAKIFRHVSSAFAEDPVRILRVARFAARYPDFTVHPDTNLLMQTMVENGEVNALVPERVWKEFSRALEEQAPIRFFEVLNQCGALALMYRELCDTLNTHITALTTCAEKTTDTIARFAALLKNLSEPSIISLCKRYCVPRNYFDLALITQKYQHTLKNLNNSDAEGIITLLENIDAFRRPERLEPFTLASDADKLDVLLNALQQAKQVDAQELIAQGFKDKEIGRELHRLRVEKLSPRQEKMG